MKVYKKDHLSLLVKIFGLGDKLYLTTTILAYFDLTDPDTPLKEQDLWRTIPEQLGEQVLDMGWPKPRGEFLVTGNCHVPGGKERPASQVAVRVGNTAKILDVFGDRFWLDSKGSQPVKSEPRPFTQMPIDYRLAYGGEGYTDNPVGRGYTPAWPRPRTAKSIPCPTSNCTTILSSLPKILRRRPGSDPWTSCGRLGTTRSARTMTNG